MLHSIFLGKKYSCEWCGKKFRIKYKPSKKNFTPLCSQSCTVSYISYSQE